MNKLIILIAITLGITIPHAFAKTAEECKKEGKPVTLHVHGAFTAKINYKDCITDQEKTIAVITGLRLDPEGLAAPNSMVRIEIITMAWPEGTENAAFINVGNGMHIDCGGTTLINRRCTCNDKPCPTT